MLYKIYHNYTTDLPSYMGAVQFSQKELAQKDLQHPVTCMYLYRGSSTGVIGLLRLNSETVNAGMPPVIHLLALTLSI